MGEAVLVHIVKPRKKGEIRLVRKTREVAGKAIREAWNESPVQRDEEMNMPDLGLGALAEARSRYLAAVSRRLRFLGR